MCIRDSHRGGEHGPDIDGHIKNRKGIVPLAGIGRVVVEVADEHLKVALAESLSLIHI